ncbi:proline dehydrogenase family protein [Texcoconibacillus texcoconensis]|uniref:proline dehydrogenase n=1 Tax=Texcoconibacillus texcoconensis TaxID=1095777 RepID=A0A840QSA8_9BACI|nr:proline dehydrogenase [Texcoconibacillus texcoconensis]MBB5174230.1 proline dehydrogenase [Texcoconibacillus texcoconensis]
MLSRQFFLFLSQSKWLKQNARRWGQKLGAKQVIAGETLEEAMNTVRKLNEQGMYATLDHLGEFVHRREEAEHSAEYCVKILQAIHDEGLECNLSLKLTQLGLDVDRDLCRDNMMYILQIAKELENFVRIDMEDYSHLDATLDILNELRQSHDDVGTAIQAYLYRAEADVRRLGGVNLRLIKGAYNESPQVAYQKQEDVDENFMNIIRTHLLNGSYAAIATHDHHIINQVKQFVKEKDISKDQFEFQMLYGFRTNYQKQLVDEGYKMRIYVPFGTDWYGYFMRRLAERPQNVRFALKGLLSK